MKRTTKYVALDVHQATTVAVVRAEGGRVIERTIVPTAGPALGECFQGMWGAIHVVLEEGTQAQWLHELLSPLVERLVVCDRRGEPILRAIPFLGPVRVAQFAGDAANPLAVSDQAAHVGLAVRTHQSAEYEWTADRPARRRRGPMTRSLNQNCNRILKDVFKGAATA